MVVIMAIEHAVDSGCLFIWLKCDSRLVVNAVTNHNIVPWSLRSRWGSCIRRFPRLQVSHFFREGNRVVLINWPPMGLRVEWSLLGGIPFLLSFGKFSSETYIVYLIFIFVVDVVSLGIGVRPPKFFFLFY